MQLAEVYATSRGRMMALAADLTDEQIALPVPATPLWTVGDVYRHVAGPPADVLGANPLASDRPSAIGHGSSDVPAMREDGPLPSGRLSP